MIIQHNLQAMNTQRTFNTTVKKQGKSMEKLSSGYRINRAADDAAGLSISEKMRFQIRGLNQAAENIQDGISLIQVAEGALNESHNILQRMNELATQAANDTNTTSDRDAIQAEVNQLTKELDKIANTTHFNNGIFPLKGGFSFPDTLSEMTIQVKNDTGADYTYDGVTYADGETFDVHNVLTVKNSSGEGTAMIYQPGRGGLFIHMSTTFSMTAPPISHYTMDDLKVDDKGYIYVEPMFGGLREYACSRQFLSVYSNNPTEDQLIASGAQKVIGSTEPLNIQCGSSPHQSITIPTINATAKSMGVDPLDVSSFANAGNAMVRIQTAINKVSGWRSDWGARQNRLEQTLNNVQNTEENTQAAESRIRDTDMAKEMQSLAVSNILAQAGQSMMAQTNSSTSSVLSLLR